MYVTCARYANDSTPVTWKKPTLTRVYNIIDVNSQFDRVDVWIPSRCMELVYFKPNRVRKRHFIRPIPSARIIYLFIQYILYVT